MFMILKFSIKHANADGLTRTDCTQCKGDGCAGRGMGLGESRILQVYEDTLDLHEQHDIQDDIALLQLPTPKGKEGLSELEKFMNITRRVHSSSESNWLGCWTATQLRDWQGQDQAVSTARAWKLANKEIPTWKAISGEGHELKALWSQWSILEVREGIFYRKYIPETGKRLEDDKPQLVYQLVAPRSLCKAIMQHLHDHKMGGHLGLRKTLYNVRKRIYWPGQCNDMACWCHRCKKCGARKPKVGKRAPLQQDVAGLPMEQIALDIMGPLPTSNSGNMYNLVIGDYFSKFTEAYALPDHTAQSVARVLIEQWICPYGVPGVIHSDQGRL